MAKIKVVKLTEQHFQFLAEQIKRNWGNISIPRGIFLLQKAYKYVPKHIKRQISIDNYRNYGQKRRNL